MNRNKLYEMLELPREVILSLTEYGKFRICELPEEIFLATMKFCTRFLQEHFRTVGTYRYVWAWWFPRQMALAEYRIGALEYEFVNGEEREIAIHIPSDADMSPQSIQKSLNEFYVFRDRYFDQWKDVKLTCDTWMLRPELGLFLREDSHILAFQKLFAIDSVDREATWYMGWIFPGCQQIVDTLPERTSLQRGLKKILLEGRTFGIAKGHIL